MAYYTTWHNIRLQCTLKIFYANLAMPFRLTRNRRGNIWVPMTAVNENFFNFVNPRPLLRKLMTSLLPEDYLFEYKLMCNLRLFSMLIDYFSWATVPHTVIAELSPSLEILSKCCFVIAKF